MQKEYEIELFKWDDYQTYESKRLKRPIWFALNNEVHLDHKLFELSQSEKWVFICILCESSKENKSTVRIVPSSHSKVWRVTIKSIISCIEKLNDVGVLRVICGDARQNVVLQDKTLQDITKHNTTKNILLSSEMTSELFELWNNSVSNLPKAKVLNDKRKKKIKAAMQDVPSLDDWKVIVSFLDSDPFYSGQNDRNWKADFDFILQAGKGLNILEKSGSAVSDTSRDWRKEYE